LRKADVEYDEEKRPVGIFTDKHSWPKRYARCHVCGVRLECARGRSPYRITLYTGARVDCCVHCYKAAQPEREFETKFDYSEDGSVQEMVL